MPRFTADMRESPIWVRRTAVGVVLVVLSALGGAAFAKQTVGLVISGGVSQGAYQAGATFALMRYLVSRRGDPGLPGKLAGAALPGPGDRQCGLGSDEEPSLDVTAGSSAGNINAFLAALSWCERNPGDLRPRENLFWDSWINVGWDKLSPEDPDAAAYVRSFEKPLSTGAFNDIDPQRTVEAPWPRGTSVYSREDGLVTRKAFAVGFAHLKQRLLDDRYRSCVVRVGLTATRTVAGGLSLGQQPVQAQRYVVPLTLTTVPRRAGAAAVTVENLVDPRLDLSSSGLRLALPPAGGTSAIPAGSIIKLIKASSAFPLAFAPIPLRHCVPEGQNDLPSLAAPFRCPGAMKAAEARFIDGGVFDNQPFGLADNLAAYHARNEERPDAPHTLFFIDVSPARGAITLPASATPRNGLTLTGQILAQRIDQVRGYENLGLARRHRDVQVRTNSRFFPLVADTLPAAFGAFMHPSFRVYDYFVGVYDGIYWIAQSLETAAPCKSQPEQANKNAISRQPPTAGTFDRVAQHLLGDDRELAAFVNNLFTYEQYWTGRSIAPPYDLCNPPSRSTRLDAQGPYSEEKHVWQVFEQLCISDRTKRRLARQGDSAALARFMKDEDFFAWASKLPRDEFLGDLSTWTHVTADRLVRRVIDVEQDDRKVKPALGFVVEDAARVGRLGLAAFLERDAEVFDLDTSSVARLSGRRWTAGRLFWHGFPNTVAWDSMNSRLMAGWEPKLRRLSELWGQEARPGFTSQLFVGFGLLGEWYPYAASPRPYELGFTVHPAALGWDPPKRVVDDLQLAWSVSLDSFTRAPVWSGLELSTHLVGSKLRIAVGVPQLFRARGGNRPSLDDGLERSYLSIGFGDLNGTLYWLARWALGGREEDSLPAGRQATP